jgi:hypothetical protein
MITQKERRHLSTVNMDDKTNNFMKNTYEKSIADWGPVVDTYRPSCSGRQKLGEQVQSQPGQNILTISNTAWLPSKHMRP